MILNKDLHILALHKMGFLTTGEKLTLCEEAESMEDLFLFSQADVEACIGRKLKPGSWKPLSFLSNPEHDIQIMEGRGIGFLYYWDPGYPQQLREIYDPPFVLFYRGTLPRFIVPSVAIVGTRCPTGAGRTAAFQVGMELSQYGITVISGLARGIDGDAHAGSLHGKGTSIAVLGNGIDTVYPFSSRNLAEKILENNGVIISEYFPGVPPLKYHFPARNRIISGLSRSLVVIQAPEKSGALITADFALDQGRDIYVHRVGLTGEQSEGTRRLHEDGAIMIEHGKEICMDWGLYVDLSQSNCDYINEEKVEHPGITLAKMLENELTGALHMHNGSYF
ncbi:MAG: DNA-processing protein DprA [Spirochaetales bacterium]|nr:DNA-processing protein DprA [Spirochaetales bacterium]